MNSDDRQLCECLPSIFFFHFLIFLTHWYRSEWGRGWVGGEEQQWSGGTIGSAGWRLAVRDVRFKNAQRALCQGCLRPCSSSNADDKPTRGISGCWQAFIYDASPAAATGSRAPRETPSSIGIACAELTILSLDGDELSMCARVSRCCAWCVRIRDPVYISNATIFGTIARVTRLQTEPSPSPLIRSECTVFRGRTDHRDTVTCNKALSSLNARRHAWSR